MVPEGSIQPAGVEKAAAPLPHCVLLYNLISQQKTCQHVSQQHGCYIGNNVSIMCEAHYSTRRNLCLGLLTWSKVHGQ